MSIKQDEISRRVTTWLDRFAVPVHLRDKPEAAQAEAEAILRMILRYATQTDYIGFLNRVFDQLDYQMKVRTWPTVNEVGAVCANVAKQGERRRAEISEPLDMSPEAINGRRMVRGEGVGEDWLYGACAVALIGGEHVTREVMERYRSAAFLSRRWLYGDEQARAWEAEAKARHEAAKAVHRDRMTNPQRRDTHVSPRQMPQVAAE